MADPFNLGRFRKAQDPFMEQIRAELSLGAKRSHWMWFVFPQVAGLGRSEDSRHFAIRSLDEARAYVADAILGPRLIECAALVNGIEGKTAHAIFGSPDNLKFHHR